MSENILKNSNLMDLVLKQTESLGVIGNEKVKKHVLLACASTYNANPDYTLNLILEQETGIGKSTLAKSIIRFFPEDRVKIISQLSEKALNHMQESLDRKIIFIEEESGNYANYAMKIAMSEHRLSYSVVEKEDGRYKTNHKEVSLIGTSFITTTTKQPSDKELEGRVLRLYPEYTGEYITQVLNSITENVKHVQKAQQVKGTGLQDIKEALSQLKVFPVEIPFVDEIIDVGELPDIPNCFRLTKIILAEIQAHTLLYQKQRENIDGTLIAQPEDYMNIRSLLEDIVNPQEPQLIQLKEQVGDGEFNVSDIMAIFGVGQTQAYKILNKLKDRNLIIGTSGGKYKALTISLPEIQASPSIQQHPEEDEDKKPVGSEELYVTGSFTDKELMADFEKLKRNIGSDKITTSNTKETLNMNHASACNFLCELNRKKLVSFTEGTRNEIGFFKVIDSEEENNPDESQVEELKKFQRFIGRNKFSSVDIMDYTEVYEKEAKQTIKELLKSGLICKTEDEIIFEIQDT